MTNIFLDLLATRDWLLADGATGTNLFNMGLTSGDAPELWNVEERSKITNLYKGSVDSGSDVFLTNSFGGNSRRLQLHNAQSRVHELSRISAEIGREVADSAGRPVAVAGSIGPTGDIFEPVGDMKHDSAVEIFHEQAEGLKAGGADVLWVETLSAPEELRAAAEGIARTGMPWCVTMSFDTAGRTMMGTTAPDMVKLVNGLDHAPVAFGANCGVGASDLLRTILGFSKTPTSIPLIAKGNAGIPKYHNGHIHYDGTPELMADYARLAFDCGAKVIGGCCGTTPAHLEKMHAALSDHSRGAAPSLETIAQQLGGFSSPDDGTAEQMDRPVRRRRGRRAA